MAGHYTLRRNDEIVIDFNTDLAPPYRVIGKYMSEDADYIRVEGTVGEEIGRDIFVPKSNIKMITRISERHPERY